MTPQDNFLVTAPVLPGREDELRRLLASMNTFPGAASPFVTVHGGGSFLLPSLSALRYLASLGE